MDLESSVDEPHLASRKKILPHADWIAADLTQSVPAGADVYMLKHVLHRRQDGDAVTILRDCRAVIPQISLQLEVAFDQYGGFVTNGAPFNCDDDTINQVVPTPHGGSH